MKSCFVSTICLLSVLFFATSASADFIKRFSHDAPGPPGTCELRAPQDFSSSEQWAWNNRLCVGLAAKMDDYPTIDVSAVETTQVCDPKKADAWPQSRTLSTRFLQWAIMTTNQRIDADLMARQLFIQCANFSDPVSLNSFEQKEELVIQDSVFRERISTYQAQFDLPVYLVHCVFRQLADFELTDFRSMLKLEGSTFDNLILTGATIGGSLDLTEAHVVDDFDAKLVKIGSVLLAERAHFGSADFSNAIFGQYVQLGGSTVDRDFTAAGVDLGSSLFLSECGDGKNSSFGGRVDFERSNVKVSLVAACATFKAPLILAVDRIGAEVDLSGSNLASLSAAGIHSVDGLFLNRAIIHGDLQAKYSHFAGRVTLSNCEQHAVYEGVVDFSGATLSGGIDGQCGQYQRIVLRGLDSNADVNFDDLHITGNLDLGGVSRIRGQFSAQNAIFEKSDADLNLNGASIGGGLFLEGPGGRFGKLDLTSADIQNEADIGTDIAPVAEAGEFLSTIDATDANFHGSVFFTGARFRGPVLLDRSRIQGQLGFRHVQAYDAMQVKGASIGGNLDLQGASLIGTTEAAASKIVFALSRVGGDVQLAGLRAQRDLDMSQTQIIGSLDLGLTDKPYWSENGGSLILAGATSHALVSSPEAWQIASRDSGPRQWMKAQLDGYSFQTLGAVGPGRSMVGEPTGALVEWLEGIRPDGKPQPGNYDQLAIALKASGRQDDVADVLYAKGQAEYHAAGVFKKCVLWIYWLTSGYGQRPWSLVWSFGVLIIIGFLFTAFSDSFSRKISWEDGEVLAGQPVRARKKNSVEIYRRFRYALDNGFPGISLSDDHKKINHGERTLVVAAFDLLKIAGYILAAAIVATVISALSGR